MGLYKRADSPIWWMSFCFNHKQFKRSTGTNDRRLAENILAKVKTQIIEGKWFDKSKNDNITMKTVIEKYIDEVSPLKKGSHERNKQITKLFYGFFREDTMLKDVTHSCLSSYKAQRLQTITKRGAISPDTVRKELSFLRQVFNVAIDEWELCKENPVRKVIKSLPPENRRVRYVRPEEAQKLRFTIPSWLKPIVIVGCQTGLRRGNIVNLTVNQIDFTQNRIIIDKTKNGDPIGIAMTSVVKETLLEVIKTRKVSSSYVFCDGKGKPYSVYKVSMAFKRACIRAGIVDLRLHDLRHDFATLMLRKRKNLAEVQHALGHKDPRMTMRYVHLLPYDLKDAFQSIDGEGTANILRFYHAEDKSK